MPCGHCLDARGRHYRTLDGHLQGCLDCACAGYEAVQQVHHAPRLDLDTCLAALTAAELHPGDFARAVAPDHPTTTVRGRLTRAAARLGLALDWGSDLIFQVRELPRSGQ